MSGDCLTRVITERDQMLNLPGSWSANLRHISENVGFLENWESFSVIPLRIAKSNLMNQYTNCWLTEIANKSKLSHYVDLIDNEWRVADHLKVQLAKHKHSLISQLRLGVLGLEVEVGRYNKIERVDRICKLCETETEDELHFLFRCSKLSDTQRALTLKNIELINID